MDRLFAALAFITAFKASNPAAGKDRVQEAFVRRFQPQRSRSLFRGDSYSIRFSEARKGTFSNTVLGLAALRAVDDQPAVVCIVRPQRVDFMLMNATFLQKVSHSSRLLRIDNVRGSFNGTDILRSHAGLENSPANFEQLFAMHSAFEWRENLDRLVEATNAIAGRDTRYRATDAEQGVVLQAPERAATFLSSSAFAEIEADLRSLVERRRDRVLEAAALSNVNTRGNNIERVITEQDTAHAVGDMSRLLDDGRLTVDVKTKLIGRASAPKAYNIDKMLRLLSDPGSVFAFLFVGVDVAAATVSTCLVPVLDSTLLPCTVVQHHWAGRNSRGVTQLAGKFDVVLAPGFRPHIDIVAAEGFLRMLLGL